MALHKWIYKGRVKKHLVEVNHAPDSGKLMIKLNGEMILYDYGITAETDQNRNYFIIIDGALCSVNVFKRKNKKKYQYDFLEEEIMAGKRIASNQEKRQKQMYWLIGVIVFLLISVALLPLYKKLNSTPINTLLLDGATTTGTITSFNKSIEPTANYTYYVNGRIYSGKSDKLEFLNGSESTPEGLPVNVGDKFKVRYNQDDFSDNILVFSEPDKTLLNSYKEAVAEKFKIKHQDLKIESLKLNAYCYCLAETIYKNFGLKGLSLFYNNLNIPENKTGFELTDFQLILTSPVYFTNEVECREDYLFSEF